MKYTGNKNSSHTEKLPFQLFKALELTPLRKQYVCQRLNNEKVCCKIRKLLEVLIVTVKIKVHSRRKKLNTDISRTSNCNEWKIGITVFFLYI
jgi:hypothetical protein